MVIVIHTVLNDYGPVSSRVNYSLSFNHVYSNYGYIVLSHITRNQCARGVIVIVVGNVPVA